MMPSGEEFRRRAQECYRLTELLQHPEHRAFALDLAKAWIGLAEHEERKAARIAPAGEEPLADDAILIIAPIADRLP
jgi:hypothetical protein